MKTTPVSSWNSENGAKMVDFAGWYMPVEFEGLKSEHAHVRSEIGLFDVSHMGEIRFRGPKALESLEWMTTNHVAKLEDGQAQYSLIPNHQGGIVDDIIVYCLKKNEDYLVCVNASNADKDFAWFVKENGAKGINADISNESSRWGQIAIQGPKAWVLLEKLTKILSKDTPSFSIREFKFENESCFLARTGYTGEDGAEIFVPWDKTLNLWKSLLNLGGQVKPIGLGARDTLRTEMKYSLYGHEIDDGTNPYSAGLGWVVKPKDKNFLGRDTMLANKEKALSRKLVGFEILDKGIPRQGYKLFSFDSEEIGIVTSGTWSPSLEKGIGIAYIASPQSAEGSEFQVEIRNRKLKAKVVATPFVKRS